MEGFLSNWEIGLYRNLKNTIAYLASASILAGCLATTNSGGLNPIAGDDSIPSAIRQHERTYPATVRVCVLLDSSFNYATGKFSVERKGYGAEEREARWDQLSRLGLFVKNQTKTTTTYTITALGKQYYSDEKCTADFNFGPTSGNSLTYGTLEFDRIVKQKYFPEGRLTKSDFRKRFTKLADWAKDKELRRAWKLQGIEEMENMQWYADTRRTSNGTEFTDGPRLYPLQR